MRVLATLTGLILLSLIAACSAGSTVSKSVAESPPSAGFRVLLVGQALIKKDLRPIAPDSVAQARDYLAGADIVFTNLEAAVAPAGTAITPRAETAAYGTLDVLDCLREMGFNMLSLANNHAWDLLEAGIATTREEVGRKGFAYAGTGSNAAEAAAAGYLDTPAGKVALVAMASGGVQLTPETRAEPDRAGVNFLEVSPDGTLNAGQKDRILAAVREAAKRASLVIVYHHNHYWGERRGRDGPPGRELRIDRFNTPTWMEDWAKQLVDAGASIYVAHGNPALHGVEVYKDKLILYGLGNYIFQSKNVIDRYGPLAWYGAVVDARFTDGQLAGLRFRPLALAMDGEARGAPYLAQGGEAAAILGRLADLSRRYGTQMRIDEDSAEVIID